MVQLSVGPVAGLVSQNYSLNHEVTNGKRNGRLGYYLRLQQQSL
jgi:hypothetical protein